MITLDCSEALKPTPATPTALQAAYEQLPESVRRDYEKRYKGLKDSVMGISFTLNLVKTIAVCYHDAILLAKHVHDDCLQKAGHPVDLELSLDETAFLTSPEAHYLVAQELSLAGVVLNSVAPRFVGAFQKGIDYIGSASLFRQDLEKHAAIANYFGHKLSIHSGSDKFSLFPCIGEVTDRRVHVKTSGTSWLEAVRVIAYSEPALYRALHQNALLHLEEARAYYVVHAAPDKVRSLDEVRDEELGSYLNENDARQLLHITYGFQLEQPELHRRIFNALEIHRREYEAGIQAHIGRHLDGLSFGSRFMNNS